ncbi:MULTISPECIES: helix-turn-helix domain-containing protein [Photorhabdus]|uniref:Helix-turn-helix domain-containing protein n=2 Tax=Photorhabdus TaxID=29487 RepID=A0A5C4RJC6_PHOLU|nr:MULTISPECIES: helix-turn-helix domain-containing protein [Photorhabdus]MCW7548438.1 helix-turn-helix domain-containing protein [Photorhabdus aballayi]TNH43781.1 helix-turn-helix domain-containing protein [Photorhabdus luminescens subsp. sonorensis]CAQ85220.1 similar to dica, regulator of dicb encoded by prophage cp-933 (putative regulatory protein) [Photorhabdus asymbiotica]
MKTNESIGARIKRLRNQQKMSQAALAELCGWASQSRIGNYESGIRNVSTDDAVILSKALGVSPAELMFGDAESSQENETSETCQELSNREKILLELFNELPDSEADELLKTLEEKKRYYNQLLEELSQKKSKKKA